MLTASLLLVAIAGVAVAGPDEDGGAAYVQGDYAAVLPLIRPFADSGMPAAQNVLGTLMAKA